MSHPPCARTPPVSQDRKADRRRGDQNRDGRDVQHRERRAEIFDVAAQIGLHLAQALARLDQVLAELIDLFLLLGRQHQGAGRVFVAAAAGCMTGSDIEGPLPYDQFKARYVGTVGDTAGNQRMYYDWDQPLASEDQIAQLYDVYVDAKLGG